MRYQKRPIIVEAVQMPPGRYHDTRDWPEWLMEASDKGNHEMGCLFMGAGDTMMIQTLEGYMKVGYNDYIIQGVGGELYPCKPDIFEASYDPVNT